MNWITRVFETPEFGLMALPAAILLGLLTAVGSGCNIALLAAVAAYAGSRDDHRRRDALLAAVSFMLATTLALAVLGAIIGFLGNAAAGNLGRYTTALAGSVAIFFGLMTLDLLPFRLRLPAFASVKSVKDRRRGLLSAAVFGLAAGAATISCTIFCSAPLVPVVLGLAAVRGQGGWGALILAMFALGYSLPLTAAMLGINLGKLTGTAAKLAKPIRTTAGLVLIAAGFWLLTSI